MKSEEYRKQDDSYQDIIHMPHHVSRTHKHMSMADRAAQFSPFAALTGYESAIQETARLTTERIELDEDGKAMLDVRIRKLLELQSNHPFAKITFFQADEKKTGGSYVTAEDHVRQIDCFTNRIILQNEMIIPIDDIIEIDIMQQEEIRE